MLRRTGWMIVMGAMTVMVLLGGVTRGHTPIASRFTYNEHLYPIFERQCGSCHVEGGIGPMSLLTYQEAYPLTQSIREEVLGLRMPPWKAEDGFGDFSNGHVLPAHEMDMILEWSAGGYPQGPRDQTPTPPSSERGWTLGTPTLELIPEERFTLSADTSQTVRFFVLPTNLESDQWITGVDVLPESSAVVRHVTIYVDLARQARTAEAADPDPGFATGFDPTAPIAVWWPGQQLVALETVGYALPAGADIVARVLYKKTWITDGQEFTDQTRIGLHLTDTAVDTIEHSVLNSPEPTGRSVTFTHAIDENATLYGLLPEVGVELSELQVVSTLPDGTSQPLLLIRDPDTNWPTRYWFDDPKGLPSGSEIAVTATLRPGASTETRPSLFGSDAPVRLLLDLTSNTTAAN